MDGIHFATVHGAGHEVPAYKPAAALQLFIDFLALPNTGSGWGQHGPDLMADYEDGYNYGGGGGGGGGGERGGCDARVARASAAAGWTSGLLCLLLGAGLALGLVRLRKWWAVEGERRFMQLQSDVGGLELPTTVSFQQQGPGGEGRADEGGNPLQGSGNGAAPGEGRSMESMAVSPGLRGSALVDGQKRRAAPTDKARATTGEGAEF